MMEFQQAYPIQYDRYLEACDAFNRGDLNLAYALYNKVFDPLPGTEGQTIRDGAFWALIEIYKADCLSKMDRDQEANEILQSPIVQVSVERFENPKYTIDYYLIHGDIAGKLGELELMHEKLIMGIRWLQHVEAKQEFLEDTYIKMLYYAREHQQWDVLLNLSKEAQMYSDHIDSFYLLHWAQYYAVFGFEGKGQLEMACKGAQLMLERYQEHGDEENIQYWQDYLQKNQAA